MSERLDIILFGATGFTGKNCIKYLHQLTKSFTWGIAGRSEAKLIQVLDEASKAIGENLKDVPIFKADVNNGESLNKMTSSAKLLINCCGPYQHYGEPVVLACLETSTHHVDISGEPYFMESIYYKYNRLAKQKGIYIISACGYDSIPTDLGIIFMKQHFEGTLHSVETYTSIYSEKDRLQFSYRTWESAVNGRRNIDKLISLRKKMFKKPLPKLDPQLPRSPSLFKSNVTNTWVKRYTGCDRSVIHRTQRYLYEENNEIPIQVNTFECVHSFAAVQFMKMITNISKSLIHYDFGKELLLNYAGIFSGGWFSRELPTDEQCNNTQYKVVLSGLGWNNDLDLKDTKFNQKPNKRIICEITGTNPGCGFTCLSVVLASIVVLTEKDHLPKEGGVYTPGAAFGKTSLMLRLIQNGVSVKFRSKL